MKTITTDPPVAPTVTITCVVLPVSTNVSLAAMTTTISPATVDSTAATNTTTVPSTNISVDSAAPTITTFPPSKMDSTADMTTTFPPSSKMGSTADMTTTFPPSSKMGSTADMSTSRFPPSSKMSSRVTTSMTTASSNITTLTPSTTTAVSTVEPTPSTSTDIPTVTDDPGPDDGGLTMTQISIIFSGAAVTAIAVVLSILIFHHKITARKRESVARKQPQSLVERQSPLERYELKEITWRDDDDRDNWSLFSEEIPVRSNIRVREFPDYVLDMARESHDNRSKLAIEYMQLHSVPILPFEVACLSQNITLNRFRNIYPYDGSRVPLKEITGELGSDYINASFVAGYAGNKYISAQAPLPETTVHFWRMVLECNVEAIVMLTKCVEMSREKSAQYWPESLNETITPGDRISVTLSSSTPYAEYHIRKLFVKHLTEPHQPVTVTQFHYTAWPDHGVPDNVMSVIRFIRHVRKLFPASQYQPLLVHCSAGVGRTGTFITLDMMMQQMRAEDTLSVCQCVRNLRTQRMKMVQSQVQYEFIHYALSELVVCGETEMTASRLRSFMDSVRDPGDTSEITYIRNRLRVLDKLFERYKWNFKGATARENINKNRFPNCLPNETYRVGLMCESKSGSDYINASFVNGYQQRDAYIVTQGPLENTVEDFWRMMWEYQCGCIVMLCQLVEDCQESSYCYWAGEEGEEMVCGRLRVRLLKVSAMGDIVERKFGITAQHFTDTLIVKMIQLTSWQLQGLPHPSAIMALVVKLNNALMSSSSKQTVVMCSDGVVRSGTFLCIHSQLERLKTEGVVDVFQAIKSARIQRPGVIPNTDHYVFCYEVLADYVEKMDAYHNFKTLM